MGILLSRASSWEKVPWYYLLSLLQEQYRLRLRNNFSERITTNHASPAASLECSQTVLHGSSSSRSSSSSVSETSIDVSFEDTVFEPSTVFTGSGRREEARLDNGLNSVSHAIAECATVNNGSCQTLNASGCNEVSVLDNPDISQFGNLCPHRASSGDKLAGSWVPRVQRVSPLSPVKEESDFVLSQELRTLTLPAEQTTASEEQRAADRTRETYRSASCQEPRGTKTCNRDSLHNNMGHESQGSKITGVSDNDSLSISGTLRCNLSSHLPNLTCTQQDIGTDLQHPDNKNDEFFIDTFVCKTHHAENHKFCLNMDMTEVKESKKSHTGGRVAEDLLKCSAEGGACVIDAVVPLNLRSQRRVTFVDHIPDSSSSSSSCPSSPSKTFSFSSSSTTFSASSGASCKINVRSILKGQGSTQRLTSTPAASARPLLTCAGLQKRCFAEPEKGSDLVLIAENKRFHVHSTVLISCHVLHEHLRRTRTKEVVLLNKRADHLLDFLHLLYPVCNTPIADDKLEGVLDMAHYLGCEAVKQMCCSYLTRLTQLPHLCPHLYLNNRGRWGLDRKLDTESDRSDDSTSLQSDSDHFRLEDFDTHDTRQQQRHSCACADIMAERVTEILMIVMKYNLHDVYHVYIDVAATIPTEEWTACARYDDLPAAIREDILTCRIIRLERVISNVSVTRSSLTGCSKSRHRSYHVTFNGELCLKCMSKKILREARTSL